MRSNLQALLILLATMAVAVHLTSSARENESLPSFVILAEYSQESFGVRTGGAHLLVAVDKFDVIRRMHGNLKCDQLLVRAFESSPEYPTKLERGRTYRLRFKPSPASTAELAADCDFLWINPDELELISK